MKFVALLLAFGYVVTTHGLPSLPVHPGVGGFYKGPNSETIIKGPDGSVITAAAEGGAIETGPGSAPIVVPEEEGPLSVVPLSPQGPGSSISTVSAQSNIAVTAHATVGNAHSVLAVAQPAPVIEAEIVDTPVIEPKQNSDLVGPSGSVSTRGSSSVISGPASTTISGPAIPVVGVHSVRLPAITGPIIPQDTISIVKSTRILPTTISPLTASDVTPINTLIGGGIPIVHSDGLNGIVSNSAVSVTPNSILSSSISPLQPTTLTTGISRRIASSTIAPLISGNQAIAEEQADQAIKLSYINQLNLQTQAQQILDQQIQRSNEEKARAIATETLRANQEQINLRNEAEAAARAQQQSEAELQERLRQEQINLANAVETANYQRRLEAQLRAGAQYEQDTLKNVGDASLTASSQQQDDLQERSRQQQVNLQNADVYRSQQFNAELQARAQQILNKQLQQAAIDQQQWKLNPANIPAVNIIPPEISLNPNRIIVQGSPTTIAPDSEGNGSPSTVSPGTQVQPSPENSLVRLPSGAIVDTKLGGLGPNQLFTPNVVYPTTIQGVNGQIDLNRVYNQNSDQGITGISDKIGDLTSSTDRVVVQNSANTNNQISTSVPIYPTAYSSQASAISGFASSSSKVASLRPIDSQPLLAAALRKEGINLSEINLATVPLSSVHQLQSHGGLAEVNGWARLGRGVKGEKTNEKKGENGKDEQVE